MLNNFYLSYRSTVCNFFFFVSFLVSKFFTLFLYFVWLLTKHLTSREKSLYLHFQRWCVFYIFLRVQYTPKKEQDVSSSFSRVCCLTTLKTLTCNWRFVRRSRPMRKNVLKTTCNNMNNQSQHRQQLAWYGAKNVLLPIGKWQESW